MLTLLLAAPALALDFSLSTTIHGSSDAWTLEDITFGTQEPLVLQADRRTHYRIEVDLAEQDGGVRYTLQVVEVQRSWLGREREAVISRPVLLAPISEPATVTWGASGAAPDVSLTMVTR